MNTRRLVVTLAFLGCLFYAGDRALSQNWAATSSPSEGWNSIASSADGTQVVAAEGSPGLIYVSKDAGANWTATTAPPDYWSCVASSADGAKLMAVSSSPSYYHGHLYTSTDSGAHWISNSPPAGFDLGVSVASSADGTKLAMVSFNSDSGTFTVISTSTNSGSTWTVPSQPYNLSSSWNWVASSADGTKLVAAEGYLGFGHIYRSIDSGNLECDQRADDQRVCRHRLLSRRIPSVGGQQRRAGLHLNQLGHHLAGPQCAVEQLGDRVAAYNHRRRLVGGWHSLFCRDVHGPDVHFDQRRSGVD